MGEIHIDDRGVVAYFRIEENKPRRIVSENSDAEYILWNGNRPQIKRIKFEKVINNIDAI